MDLIAVTLFLRVYAIYGRPWWLATTFAALQTVALCGNIVSFLRDHAFLRFAQRITVDQLYL